MWRGGWRRGLPKEREAEELSLCGYGEQRVEEMGVEEGYRSEEDVRMEDGGGWKRVCGERWR